MYPGWQLPLRALGREYPRMALRERTQARTVARWVDLVRAAGVGAKKMKVSLAGVGVVKIGYCKDRRFDSH